ncbi:MAG: pyridoxal phosphate-dependent aminotransferase, partial [Deltaproteobacteria bacterium]|nr:pyridoxal phosphate-dependent aminotransferase [Deltaproteobacteria bacterium]
GETGVTFAANQIIACAGAKQALYNACMALLDEGDEAIVPVPGWVSYPDMVKLAGATPVDLVLDAARGFIPRPGDLTKLLTPKTRVLMLGSPANPTGAILPPEALKQIAEELKPFPNVVVLSDDIYGRLWYTARPANILQAAPELAERTLLINGCSKAFAMTGLRLGWACGPAPIIAAMNKVQDSSTSNPSSIAQDGAVAALMGPQEGVEHMRQVFAQRRTKMVSLLSAIPGVKAAPPDGAFYVFCDVSALLERSHKGARVGTTLKLSEILLDEHLLAVVPGSAFGAEGFLRLSFASSEREIERAMERMAACAASLT